MLLRRSRRPLLSRPLLPRPLLLPGEALDREPLRAELGRSLLRAELDPPVLRAELDRPVLRAELDRPLLRAELDLPVLRAELERDPFVEERPRVAARAEAPLPLPAGILSYLLCRARPAPRGQACVQ